MQISLLKQEKRSTLYTVKEIISVYKYIKRYLQKIKNFLQSSEYLKQL